MHKSTIRTPLCFATYHNHIDAMELLIEHGADVDYIAKNKYAAIHYAATNPSTDVLIMLINSGADINLETNQKRMTALHIAAYSGNLDGLIALIDVGADIDALDIYGRGAIHYAAWGNRVNIINHFIYMDDNGIHINFFLPDSNGVTPYTMSTNDEVRNKLLQRSPFRRPSA